MKTLQKIAIWILKITNYKFKVEHDKFEIDMQPVGVGNVPTRYDFVCNHKDIGYMGSQDMVVIFPKTDILECANHKTSMVALNYHHKASQQKYQYDNLVKTVVKSAKVVI